LLEVNGQIVVLEIAKCGSREFLLGWREYFMQLLNMFFDYKPQGLLIHDGDNFFFWVSNQDNYINETPSG